MSKIKKNNRLIVKASDKPNIRKNNDVEKTNSSKVQLSNYQMVADKILTFFNKSGKQFHKKEIFAWCKVQKLEIGNWGSLLKNLHKGNGKVKLHKIVTKGPNAAYIVVPIDYKFEQETKINEKKQLISKNIPARKKLIVDYAKGTEIIIDFINSLLDKEVSKQEIMTHCEGHGLSTGNWSTFSKYLRKGNSEFSVVTNGKFGKYCKYVLRNKNNSMNTNAIDDSKVVLKSRQAPLPPVAAKKVAKKPIKPIPKKIETTKIATNDKNTNPQNQVEVHKTSSEQVIKVPSNSGQGTSIQIPPSDKPILITIKIEIG